MFEFVLFIAACAVIAFLVASIHKSASQPKVKMQPIKIEREQASRPARRQRPY